MGDDQKWKADATQELNDALDRIKALEGFVATLMRAKR